MAKKDDGVKKKPLEVTDPKRVKSYNDSLSLYNSGIKKHSEYWGKSIASSKKDVDFTLKNSKIKGLNVFTGRKSDNPVKGNIKPQSYSGRTEIPYYKKPITPVVMKKKDDGTKKVSITKKPIQLQEVKVSAQRAKPKTDSVSVGYAGKFTKMGVNDVKSMVKKNNLKSIDTTSTKSMNRTSYGSSDMKGMADAYLAKKKK